MPRKKINSLSHSDLRLLHIFKTVAENNGVTAAQGILGKSKATISIALSDLETRLGFSLCQRGRSGFKLTAEGKITLRSYQDLHNHIIDFTNKINSIDESISGSLKIYIDDNFIYHQRMLITDTLKKISQDFQNINIHLIMGSSIKAKSKLIQDEVDIAIMQATTLTNDLYYIDLYNEKEFLYCSNLNPIFSHNHQDICIKEIMKLPTILSSYSTGIDWKQYNTKAKTNDKEATAFLILTGEYTGYLPSFYAKQWVDSNDILPLKPKDLNNDINYRIAIKPSRKNDLLIKIWLDCFQSIFGKTERFMNFPNEL